MKKHTLQLMLLFIIFFSQIIVSEQANNTYSEDETSSQVRLSHDVGVDTDYRKKDSVNGIILEFNQTALTDDPAVLEAEQEYELRQKIRNFGDHIEQVDIITVLQNQTNEIPIKTWHRRIDSKKYIYLKTSLDIGNRISGDYTIKTITHIANDSNRSNDIVSRRVTILKKRELEMSIDPLTGSSQVNKSTPYTLTLKNRGCLNLELELSSAAENDLKIEFEKKYILLPASQEKNISFNVTAKEYGTWELTVYARDAKTSEEYCANATIVAVQDIPDIEVFLNPANIAFNAMSSNSSILTIKNNDACPHIVNISLILGKEIFAKASPNITTIDPDSKTNATVTVSGNLPGTFDVVVNITTENKKILNRLLKVTVKPGKPPGPTDIIIENISNVSATIRWNTKTQTNSALAYGKTQECKIKAKEESENKTEHTILLDRLDPDTTYYFIICSENSHKPPVPHNFTTAKRYVQWKFTVHEEIPVVVSDKHYTLELNPKASGKSTASIAFFGDSPEPIEDLSTSKDAQNISYLCISWSDPDDFTYVILKRFDPRDICITTNLNFYTYHSRDGNWQSIGSEDSFFGFAQKTGQCFRALKLKDPGCYMLKETLDDPPEENLTSEKEDTPTTKTDAKDSIEDKTGIVTLNKRIPSEKPTIANTPQIAPPKSDKKKSISDELLKSKNNGTHPEENASKDQNANIKRHPSDIPITGNSIKALPKKPLFGLLMLIASVPVAVHIIKKKT